MKYRCLLFGSSQFARYAKQGLWKKIRPASPEDAQLVRVLSTAGDVIHVDDVVIALQLDRTAAAQRLSRWAEQGWLRRVGRSAYVAASIDTMGSDRVLNDPWVLAPALFAPASDVRTSLSFRELLVG